MKKIAVVQEELRSMLGKHHERQNTGANYYGGEAFGQTTDQGISRCPVTGYNGKTIIDSVTHQGLGDLQPSIMGCNVSGSSGTHDGNGRLCH